MADWYDYAGDPVSEARWNRWSEFSDLPMPGEMRPFDDFLDRKGLRRDDLSRVGARWDASSRAIAYLFPDGIKWRRLDGQRWSEQDVTWSSAKKIPVTPSQAAQAAVVAEGETDGAWLAARAQEALRVAASGGDGSEEVPRADSVDGEGSPLHDGGAVRDSPAIFDVFVLPAGAKAVPANLAQQLNGYREVYLALDADVAGEDGVELLRRSLGGVNTRRLLPPGGSVDWCDSDPGRWGLSECVVKPPRTVFSVREVIAADLGSYAENNWFDGDICPIGGETIIHGPIKSLKSVVATELAKGIACGLPFAGYLDFCRPAGPGKVLLIQFEIPPRGFQMRMKGMVDSLPVAQRDLFLDNFMIFGVADRTRPRLKMQDNGFVATIRNAVEEAEAEVVMFDPMQRMTGGANADKAHEMEPILDVFSQLQASGLTVVYTHHDTKSGGNDTAAYNMSGSQRFGADADSICSLIYDPKVMIPDDNPGGIKQRNFVWTLRSGSTQGRSITASPDMRDPEFMHVTYDAPVVAAPAVTSGVTSSATATGAALGMPAIK